MKHELTTGFKIWFGIILIVNAAVGIFWLSNNGPILGILCLMTAIGAIGLFQLKKWGFWLAVIPSIIMLILQIAANNTGDAALNFAFPLALYFSLKKSKNNYWEKLN